ncbi:UNVERIFIED_CONTAM: sarcosine oxidase subunit beta [Acetivibrio alkalicellulosi]
MINAEVIIVGGGVIGSSIAHYLAKNKVDVLVLEKNDIGSGASSRNGGGIRQSARDLREMPLAIHAVKNLWPYLSEELGVDVEYHQKGNLRLAKNNQHLKVLEKIVEHGQSVGLDLKMIDGDQVKELCPFVSHEVIGASYCATDGHGNPMTTTLGFYKRARELGARFITGESVKSLIIKKGKISGVKTLENIYEAPIVIVASGLESRSIANTAGIDLPMQKVMLEALITEDQSPMFSQMIGTAASDFYGHQTEHGSFVFGGMTGLEPFDSQEENAVTRNIAAPSICRAILGYFPFFENVKIIRTWSGFLDEMVDHVPVISKVEEVPGLILACGFSGHGYGISPAVGQLIAQMIVEGQPSISLEAFKYDRFKPRV